VQSLCLVGAVLSTARDGRLAESSGWDCSFCRGCIIWRLPRPSVALQHKTKTYASSVPGYCIQNQSIRCQ
jgi:hypothetical protein